MVTIQQNRKKREVYPQSYYACRHIRDKEALRSVDKICLCRAVIHAFVEKASLEEKERHEVECPLHNMRPPLHFSHSAEVHNVQTYHANDTKSAQKIERMIPILHLLHIFLS